MIGNITLNTQRTLIAQKSVENEKIDTVQQTSSLTALQKIKQEQTSPSDIDMDKVSFAKALIKNPEQAIDLNLLANQMINFYHGETL